MRVIHLSRNFGHQAALTAGLEHAAGDVVAMIDADLQDPPELIPRMIEQWEQGSDVVYAVRKQRDGETAFKLATASWFYKLFDKLAQVDLEPNSGDFRLLDRRALDALLSMTERSRFLRGMTVWVGFTQTAVPYERDARTAGETKYTLRKMLRFSLDAIASFSHLPLQLATYVGLLSAGVAFIAIPIVIALHFTGCYLPGFGDAHDRDPAARRHPADRARRDRRVRGAHLRRGQAPPAVHRARGAQPPADGAQRTGRLRARRAARTRGRARGLSQLSTYPARTSAVRASKRLVGGPPGDHTAPSVPAGGYGHRPNHGEAHPCAVAPSPCSPPPP